MNRALRVFVFLGLVATVACIACWFTARYVEHHSQISPDEAHHWIHSQLNITPDQEKALEPIEQRFAEKQKHYAELIRIANLELSEALLTDRRDSPRVTAAISRIHSAQGELQTATLQHIFEMQPVLTPQQYEKLLKLTAEALKDSEHGR